MPKPTFQEEVEAAERFLQERWSKKQVPTGEEAFGFSADDPPSTVDAYYWDVFAYRRWDKVHEPSIRRSMESMTDAGRAYYIGTFLRYGLHDLKSGIEGMGIACVDEVRHAMHGLRSHGLLAQYFDEEDIEAIKTCMKCFRKYWPEFKDEEQMFLISWRRSSL